MWVLCYPLLCLPVSITYCTMAIQKMHAVKSSTYIPKHFLVFLCIGSNYLHFPCSSCRLFTTVRDSLGLTYDVSFELNLFDRLKLGWYVISVTSTPSKVWTWHLFYRIDYFAHLGIYCLTCLGWVMYIQVHKAVDACKNVLRGLHSNKITLRELDRVSFLIQFL